MQVFQFNFPHLVGLLHCRQCNGRPSTPVQRKQSFTKSNTLREKRVTSKFSSNLSLAVSISRYFLPIAFFVSFLSVPCQSAYSYPVFAQQNYANPREANGRIVCANCHLAQKSVEIEIPQSVLPDSVFEAVVKIPYDQQVTQVLGNGKKGGLNVGAVLILPDGFSAAPAERIPAEMKTKVGKLYIQPYADD